MLNRQGSSQGPQVKVADVAVQQSLQSIPHVVPLPAQRTASPNRPQQPQDLGDQRAVARGSPHQGALPRKSTYRKPGSSERQIMAGLPTESSNSAEFTMRPARKPQRHRPQQPHPQDATSVGEIPSTASQRSAALEQRPQIPRPHNPSPGYQARRNVQSQPSYAQDSFQRQAYHPPRAVPRQWIHTNSQQTPVYDRPAPRHRQLFDPNQNISQSNQPPWLNRLAPNTYAASQAAVQAQIAYLDAIAIEEIPKAMISPGEEQQKESMRQTLEDVCQRVITEHEVEKDALFDGSSVSLQCYGSLRTGFATHSSDMDLVLGSPNSNPHISSTESELPRLIEKALLDLGYGARLLTRTRMPLIKFCEKPTPELAGRLREERKKWEKERDTPPKPKEKAKVSQKDKKSAPNDAGSSDPPNPRNASTGQVASSDEAVNAVCSALQPNDPGHETIHAQSVEPTVADCVQEADNDVVSADGHSLSLQQLSLADSGASKPHASVDAADTADVTPGLKLPGEVKAMAQTKAQKSTPVVPKERRENVLSDDEIVHLYQLAIKEGWFEPEERKIIYAFFKAVESGITEDQQECKAQLLSLPDVLNRYRPPPDHLLDYPKDGVGVQCDIIFSNPLAIHNSAMLRCYNLSDPRVKPMVLFVKAWAKRRKINSPYHGTLSSYGYVLMVLHYLVNIARPPICLNLQNVEMALRDTSIENTQIVDGYGVRFWRNEEAIQRCAMQGHVTPDRESSVGCLLKGFFQYFATPTGGFSWAMEVLSLRTPGGILTKAQKGWVAAKTEVLDPAVEGQKGQEVRQRYLFAIEDPFETNHNIARTVVHNGIVAIRDEFRRANRLIHQAGNGQPTEDLFAEAESKDDLNYRHFGPRPRPPPPKPVGQQPGKPDAKHSVPARQGQLNSGTHQEGKEGATPQATGNGVASMDGGQSKGQ
ncbi:MAG: hypothetical protein Q9207_006013 [Kuettlingeria erythrocarpa]